MASICHASRARARMVALLHAMWSGPRPVRQFRQSRVESSAAQIKALYEGVAYEEIPLDSMRRTSPRRAWSRPSESIPHFYLTADLSVGRLIAMREEANAAAPKSRRRRSRIQAFASMISSSKPGLRRCSVFRQRTPCGQAMVLPAFMIRILGLREGVKALKAGWWQGFAERRSKITYGYFNGDARSRGPRTSKEAQAERISGRLECHLQSRHVRGARVFRHHKSAPGQRYWRSAARDARPIEGDDGGVKFIDQDDRYIVV